MLGQEPSPKALTTQLCGSSSSLALPNVACVEVRLGAQLEDDHNRRRCALATWGNLPPAQVLGDGMKKPQLRKVANSRPSRPSKCPDCIFQVQDACTCICVY